MKVMISAIALLLATPAFAQTAATPDCRVTTPAFPGPLATWPKPVVSDGKLIAVGQAAKLVLVSQAKLKYAVKPQKDGLGAILTVQVMEKGRYQIASSGRVWIDVLHAGGTLASVEHGHGAACTGIAKIVQFDLEPGPYTIALSGGASPDLTLLIAPAS
ncbi:hypothetical protein [Sphingomonas montanisoli]|uniref:Homogentisate 1,2-dioxygenase n=1 Tax=Sphingomonas montanisoli TaxID=2606412 RepID=A0A5D9C690_9SPHN|nr:hypothetical protein [Sphingomonas montanisoli]TZG27199.1 hypothetical protein FYJ91_06125 [Sphingomonas montanisoli]